jgi:alkyl hydroperoxide reductase subunit AhpF
VNLTDWTQDAVPLAADGGSELSVSGYDLIVIGSGPAGQKGAVAAAKAHKRVAVIDQKTMIGGVWVSHWHDSE